MKYNYYNIGLGLYEWEEQIYQITDFPSRVLPYKDRDYAIAVTYEMETQEVNIFKLEPTFFDWLSAVGGLSSILFAISQLIGSIKSTQMFVTSSMM